MTDNDQQHVTTRRDDGNTSVAVQEKPAPTKTDPKQLPPYKVLLHNDDENTFEQVILVILKLTRLTTEDAIERTVEAHESGVSLLLATHRERAELYQEQFLTFQITTTIEPA